jgi:hypothetical protein
MQTQNVLYLILKMLWDVQHEHEGNAKIAKMLSKISGNISKSFSHQKVYGPCIKQIYIKQIFSSFITTQNISISFCSMDGHTIFWAIIICMKFNSFHSFWKKAGEGLILDVIMLSNNMNKELLSGFVEVVYFVYILLS